MPATPRLALTTQNTGDRANLPGALNPALALIDVLMAVDDQGPYSALPAATTTRRGFYYWVTDPGRQALLRCTGTAWVPVDTPQATIDAPATNLVAGLFAGHRVRYRPDPLNAPWLAWNLRWDGTRWVADGQQPAQRGGQANDFASLALGNQFQTVPVPKYIVPFAGDWEFDIAVDLDQRDTTKAFQPVRIFPSANTGNYLPTSEPSLCWVPRGETYENNLISGSVRLIGVPAGATVGIYFTCPNGSAVIGMYDRRISARPLRIAPGA